MKILEYFETENPAHWLQAIKSCSWGAAKFLAKLLEEGQLYARSGEAVWMCQNCGHLYKGGSVPDVCPVCQHNRGYFVPIDMAPWTC